MTKLAFIVEGHQEQFIIKRICPNAKVTLLGVNGDHTSMEAIAKKIYALFGILGNRYYPVIVIFDRERRKKSCEDLKIDLIANMRKMNLPIDQFVISIVDRTLESWIVPFISEDGTILSEPEQSADGISSETKLIKRLKQGGVDYHKTTNGVDVFCKISPLSLSRISPSFNALGNAVKPHCRWIESF